MNKIKRFIFNRLFNNRQRNVIWQAVLYSEYAYKRKNNAEGVARVRQVINEVAQIAATKQRTYLESQVNEIVNAALKGAEEKIAAAYKEGKAAGVKATIDEMKHYVNGGLKKFGIIPTDVDYNGEVHFINGMKIDREKCQKCKHADDCFVKAAIDEIEADESESGGAEKKNATDAHENAEREIPVEGAEEAHDTDGADAPEVDEDREGDKDKAEK